MQVIYVDVLFFINFIMDCAIFASTAILMNKSPSKRRLVLGSLIAALLYCLSIIVPLFRQLPFYMYDFLIPIIPIVLIYKVKGYKEFFKIFLGCHLASFLIGGGIWNMYYMFMKNGTGQKMSIMLVVSIGLGIWLILYSLTTYIRQRFIMPHFEYTMTLVHKGEQVKLNGYLDSGNTLYTLTSKKPVTIITYDAIDSLLSCEERRLIKAYEEKGIEGIIENKESIKTYLIPYESVGCKADILLGFMMEKMVLEKGMFHKTFEKCVIGIVPHTLFKGQDYDALIHPDYMIIW